MTRYIGVKIVKAVPMTKDVYEKHNGFDIHSGLGLDGYMVTYPDGHVTWSPKEQFERAYLEYPHAGEAKVAFEMVENFMGKVEDSQLDEKTCLVKAETLTGFTQYEMSACVSPGDYVHEVGVEIAKKRIRDTLWMCLGFVARWGTYGLKRK